MTSRELHVHVVEDSVIRILRLRQKLAAGLSVDTEIETKLLNQLLQIVTFLLNGYWNKLRHKFKSKIKPWMEKDRQVRRKCAALIEPKSFDEDNTIYARKTLQEFSVKIGTPGSSKIPKLKSKPLESDGRRKVKSVRRVFVKKK